MRPSSRAVEARHQLDQRGLARSVLADERELLRRTKMERDAAQRRLRCARVREPHVLEAEPVLGARTARLRAGLRNRRRRREEREELGHVEDVLVARAHVEQHPGQPVLCLPEDEQEHRHVAEGELAPRRSERDPRVRPVEGHVCEEREEQRIHPLADRAIAIRAVVAIEDRAVAPEEERTEAEELHLFDVVVPGDRRLEVALLARLVRAPPKDSERVLGEARLDEERRNRDAEDEHDGQGEDLEEEDPVADERDDVAHERERSRDERDRPVARAAPRGGHLVVELGPLEVGQRERQRLLEDSLVDALRELRAKERLAQPLPALDDA